MLQTFIYIPKNNTTIGYGSGKNVTVKSFKHTSCVNDGDELSIGSVCASAVEVTIFDIGGTVDLTAGDEIWIYRGETEEVKEHLGTFIIEQPTRPSANTMKLSGYDRVIKLDKDLTGWLNGLKNWPYKLSVFTEMVAEECDVFFGFVDWEKIPNNNYLVQKFSYTGVTGRQLMKWLCEICARYCFANSVGNLELGWYKSSGVTITPSGERFYFEGGLTYEAYQTAPIETVQLQLADSESGALWPERDSSLNSYVITNNAILQAQITDDVLPHLDVIANALKGYTYTPCKVAIPTSQDIPAGSTVDIIDRNEKKITAYVMTKVTEGQKDTIECTGSARRDSTKHLNNRKPASQIDAANSAKNAVQKAQEIFGEKQGLYYQDGKWYINAEVVQVLNLVADMINAGTLYGMLIKAGKIQSEDGKIEIDLSGNGEQAVFSSGISTNHLLVRYDPTQANSYFEVFPEEDLPYSYSNMVLRSTGVASTPVFGVKQIPESNIQKLPYGFSMELNESKNGNCLIRAIGKPGQSTISCSAKNIDGIGVATEIFALDDATGQAGIVIYDKTGTERGFLRWVSPNIYTEYTEMGVERINGREVSWKANGDGTYTLIGV